MTSYNILITDDEAFIVDWLSSLLEAQKELNIYIYRAYTSQKALELIERTRIDLLISDIQMPVYNGFELSEKMNRMWPNSKTILLTAYSDFNYAQKAIRQGIVSYVLKTADDNEILTEIKKALSAIDQECNQISFINNIEKDLRNYQAKLYAQIFSLWIRGHYTSLEELQENISILGFDPASTCFVLILCRIDKISEAETGTRQSFMKSFQIQRLLEHNLAPYSEHYIFEIENDLIPGILQLHPSIKKASQIIRDALDLTQSTCLKTLGCHISCLISPSGGAASIPNFWSQGSSLLPGFTQETDFIFSYENDTDASFSLADNNHLLRPSFYNTMRKYLENGERELFALQLKEVCDYLSQNANWHNTYSLQIYFSLVLIFINYINEKKLNTTIAFHTSTGILFRPWLSESWAAIEANLRHTADALFSLQEAANQDSGNHIVETVRRYIDGHITEDVSLLDLADATGYSTSYLSKYYSDVTGSTISEYMASRKLAKISQLMAETNLNIGSIADAMGFHSRTYFNNYIRRLTGMSPQQYRDSLTSE